VGEKVFTDSKCESPTEGAVTKKFKRCAAAAGLSKDPHFHSLRHTFGTRAANQGVPTNILKAVMGHSNFKTTEGYMGADQAAIREQMGRVTLRVLPAGIENEPASRKTGGDDTNGLAEEDAIS
jgi:integrase